MKPDDKYMPTCTLYTMCALCCTLYKQRICWKTQITQIPLHLLTFPYLIACVWVCLCELLWSIAFFVLLQMYRVRIIARRETNTINWIQYFFCCKRYNRKVNINKCEKSFKFSLLRKTPKKVSTSTTNSTKWNKTHDAPHRCECGDSLKLNKMFK